MTCNNCAAAGVLVVMEEITEGVDIGVGTQIHVTGYHCPRCGQDYGVCSKCGGVDGHCYRWCGQLDSEIMENPF